MKKKIIIITIVIIILLSFVIAKIFIETNKKHENKEINIPNSIKLENVETEEFIFSTISINHIDNYYKFEFSITNKLTKKSELKIVKYIFLDKNNNVIEELENELQPLEAKETITYELRTNTERMHNVDKLKIKTLPITLD